MAPLRASALTFFHPAVTGTGWPQWLSGIAKGFGFERRLQQELLDNFSAQQEVVQQVIGFAQNMLNNTKRRHDCRHRRHRPVFGAVIKVLSNIESSFNHIWGVRSRKFIRKTERLPDHHAGLPGAGDHVRQRHRFHHFSGYGHFRPVRAAANGGSGHLCGGSSCCPTRSSGYCSP